MTTPSANMQGALLMMAAMTAFTINDAFLKLLGTDLPFFQVIFTRSAFVVAILLVLAGRKGAIWPDVTRRDRWLVFWRSAAEAVAAYMFILALFHMPIANVSAILQALPLTVTLAAALFLGEPVGWRRFLAIGIGFIGVLLIVRPGTEGFTVYSLYALGAVAAVTVRDLTARQLSAKVPSLFVALAAGSAVLIFSGVGAVFGEWEAMNATEWMWMAGSVVTMIGAYLASVMSMRVGEIGVVAPFRYTSLVVAIILGVLVFGDWPDTVTFVGAGVVMGTGLFTLWRERHQTHHAPVPLRPR